MQDHYEILEVNPKASNEVIKKVFKYHIKNNHPDLFQGDEKLQAEIKIKQINEAYEVLSNEDKRKLYDEELKVNKLNEISNNNLHIEEENSNLKQELDYKNKLLNRLASYFDEEQIEHIIKEQEIAYNRNPSNNKTNNIEENTVNNEQYVSNKKVVSGEYIFKFLKKLITLLVMITALVSFLHIINNI